jgi:hypothetical protein
MLDYNNTRYQNENERKHWSTMGPTHPVSAVMIMTCNRVSSSSSQSIVVLENSERLYLHYLVGHYAFEQVRSVVRDSCTSHGINKKEKKKYTSSKGKGRTNLN